MKARIFTLIALALTLSMGMLNAQDVYVTGAKKIKNGVGSADTDAVFTAGYWKNGSFIQLGAGVKASYAQAILITDEDIYVGGYENDGTKNVAKLWKNGVLQTLSSINNGNAASAVLSVSLKGSDVYCAGYDRLAPSPGASRVALLWKNGVAIPLGSGTRYASARSVFIAGDYIYVAGHEVGTLGKAEAKYWKVDASDNVTEVLLDGNSSTNDFYATSIHVDGEDIYVAGYEFYSSGGNVNIPKYWKNGVAVNLSSGSPLATGITTASSIFVDGEDVHVTGVENATNVARYWKNGVQTDLTLTDITNSMGRSVYVHDNDVYIAGKGTITTIRAIYWKNGVPVVLEPTPGESLSIMVVDPTLTTGLDLSEKVSTIFNSITNNLMLNGVWKGRLMIYDVNGKLVFSKQINGEESISLASFEKGLYLVKIVTPESTCFNKIIKQ